MKKIIQNNNTICFDIFDTLLIRKVFSPTDIFSLLASKFTGKPYAKYIYITRIIAERYVREALPDLQEEITYKEIYHLFNKIMLMHAEKDGFIYSKEDNQDILEKEILLEKHNLIPRKEMVELFEYSKSLNKDIYLLSDMYLPKNILVEILSQNGINGYKDLLVSCELNKTKHTGNMYTYFLEHYNPPHPYLMIGDNYLSDYTNAVQHGFQASFVPKRNKGLSPVIPASALNISDSFMANNGLISGAAVNYRAENNAVSYANILGFQFIAPFSYMISENIMEHALKNHLDTIVFLSRDGFYFYQSFLKRYEETIKNKNLKVVYITCSRSLMLKIDIADKLESQHFHRLTKLYSPLSVKELLLRTQINPEEHLEVIHKYFPSMDFLISPKDKVNIQKCKDMFLELEEEIKTISHNSQILYKRYVQELNLINSNILLVDIGWTGETIRLLQNFLEPLNHKVTSYLVFYRPDTALKYDSSIQSLVNPCVLEDLLEIPGYAMDRLEYLLCREDKSALFIKEKDNSLVFDYFYEDATTAQIKEQIFEGFNAYIHNYEPDKLLYDPIFIKHLYIQSIFNLNQNANAFFNNKTLFTGNFIVTAVTKKKRKIYQLFFPKIVRKIILKYNYKVYKTIKGFFEHTP